MIIIKKNEMKIIINLVSKTYRMSMIYDIITTVT